MLYFLIISFIFFIISLYNFSKARKITIEKAEQQQIINNNIKQLEEKVLNLNHQKQEIQNKIESEQNNLNYIMEKTIKFKENNDALILSEKERIDNQIQDYQNNINIIKNNYINSLEVSYDEAEKKYYDRIKELNDEIYNVEKELEKFKSTMKANIEAQLRAKEIKEKLSFYCLSISDSDKIDIKKLENIKSSLNKPRVLSMLIWQTWFQKPLKSLAANILGLEIVTGIYKITNITTDECYIGQAVDVATRWNEHAKCGLGIDTPANNKLYAAMQEYGLWNFSWELLEKCPREQLNEKERYYIDIYNSYEYGYNSSRGIGVNK